MDEKYYYYISLIPNLLGVLRPTFRAKTIS